MKKMRYNVEAFEATHGTDQLLKAIISVQMRVLVEAGITTEELLRQMLDEELALLDEKFKQ